MATAFPDPEGPEIGPSGNGHKALRAEFAERTRGPPVALVVRMRERLAITATPRSDSIGIAPAALIKLALAIASATSLGCCARATDPMNDTVSNDAELDTATSFDATPPTLPGRDFHLPGPWDATSLGLWDDGTFLWEINGCDFGFVGCGSWQLIGTTIVLSPRPGSATLQWPTVEGTVIADHVDVSETDAGANVEVFLHDGSRVDQMWTHGRICPVCGGLGPRSEPVACDLSLPARCGSP